MTFNEAWTWWAPDARRIRIRVLGWIAAVALFAGSPVAGGDDGQPAFQRGDSDGDGSVGLADAVWTLRHLFFQDGESRCDDALDASDDGQVDIGDAVYTLFFLYGGGPAI